MSVNSLQADEHASTAPKHAAAAAFERGGSPEGADANPSAGVGTGRFVLTVLCTSVVHLVLHVLGYAFVLRHVFGAFPAGTPEFVEQLVRPAGELVIWAMAVTTFSMGWFITTMMKWSGARSVSEGLKRGLVVGALFWTAVNSGLYASSRHFSLPSVLADTPMSALCMAFASAFAVWMLYFRSTFRSRTNGSKRAPSS